MFAGFFQYILKIFFIYTQQKTCPFGQVFNNDGLQAAQTGSIVCNHQFFVGRNHNGNSFAVGSGNHTGIAETGFQVGFLVNVQTEEAQVAQYTFADDVGVFTDTAGEDQCVQTACRYCHAANVFSQAVR